jgi:hypothetical protein
MRDATNGLACFGDSFIAEALAFRDAVIFARVRGFQAIVFEVDCEELVRCWEARTRERTVAPLLYEVNLECS